MAKGVASAFQARTPGEQVNEPTDGVGPPHSAAVNKRAHHEAATDTGLDARAPPAASPEMEYAAKGAPCPQGTNQPEAETCVGLIAEDTDQPGTETGGQGDKLAADALPVPTQWEPTAETTNNAHPPDTLAVDKRSRPDTAANRAYGEAQDSRPPGAPEVEKVLLGKGNKRTGGPAMMTPSTRLWGPAGTGPLCRPDAPFHTQPYDASQRTCHPHKGPHLSMLPGAPTSQLCRPGTDCYQPHSRRGGRSRGGPVCGDNRPDTAQTGRTGPWGPCAGSRRRHQQASGPATSTDGPILGTGEPGLRAIRRGRPPP